MPLLSTQMWIAFSAFPPIVVMGQMSDLEEPEREMVEMMAAERHSSTPGRAPCFDLQETCHFSRVTAAARKLKKPSCSRQDEQNMLRLGAFVSPRSCRFEDPSSNPDRENWRPIVVSIQPTKLAVHGDMFLSQSRSILDSNNVPV